MGARARAQAAPKLDRSWMKYARCKVCGFKMAMNNYADQKVRVFRRRGVVVCPWCRDGAVAFYIMTRTLANSSKADYKELRKEAQKLLKTKFDPQGKR